MEWSQRGCTLSCEGVCDFLEKQGRVHTSYMTTSSIVDFRVEMGKHFYGLHHKIIEGAWNGLYLCGGG